ncbi:MAG TPA: response regulator [Ktedonobacteraceae bacterium]
MDKTILVAEDDPAIAIMLQMMLEGAGYQVKLQGYGHGLQQMQEPFPNLLLLDMLLSGMDGREICRSLKSQDRTRHIPIIFISAQPGAQKMASEAGADAFLAKPFALDDLLGLVARFV